jgi:hypothetical protein
MLFADYKYCQIDQIEEGEMRGEYETVLKQIGCKDVDRIICFKMECGGEIL